MGGYNIRKFRRKHQKRRLFLPRDHSTGRHSVILYRMLHWTCCLAAEGPEGAQRVGRHLSKRHVLDIGIVFSSGDNPDALRVKNLRSRRCSFRFVLMSCALWGLTPRDRVRARQSSARHHRTEPQVVDGVSMLFGNLPIDELRRPPRSRPKKHHKRKRMHGGKRRNGGKQKGADDPK